jgi:AraC family transcriptional regulator
MANEQLPINYGNEFAKYFALKEAPSVLLKPRSRSQLAITRLTVKKRLVDFPKVIPEKAFTISVHLYKPVCRGWGTLVDGKFLPVESWMEGGVGIYDLESDPRAYRNSAFDSVHYNLPRTTLDAFTDDGGLPKVGALLATQGVRDDTIFQLTKLILPALRQPKLFCQLFLDHFVLMLCSHVVHTYSASRTVPKVYQGGLAPWQTRRTTELLHEHLDGELRLSTLASACGLSVSHFARSFKVSFGTPVHRYLISQRLETAKDLLLHSNKSLSDIALQVGFSDQAAFSRTFSALVGITPGRWRRENTHMWSPRNLASSHIDPARPDCCQRSSRCGMTYMWHEKPTPEEK